MQHVQPPISLVNIKKAKAGSLLPLKEAILKHLFMQLWQNKQKNISFFKIIVHKK